MSFYATDEPLPKDKFDHLPKLALSLHLLEQIVDSLRQGIRPSDIEMTTIINHESMRKAVLMKNHFQAVKDDIEHVNWVIHCIPLGEAKLIYCLHYSEQWWNKTLH